MWDCQFLMQMFSMRKALKRSVQKTGSPKCFYGTAVAVFKATEIC